MRGENTTVILFVHLFPFSLDRGRLFLWISSRFFFGSRAAFSLDDLTSLIKYIMTRARARPKIQNSGWPRAGNCGRPLRARHHNFHVQSRPSRRIKGPHPPGQPSSQATSLWFPHKTSAPPWDSFNNTRTSFGRLPHTKRTAMGQLQRHPHVLRTFTAHKDSTRGPCGPLAAPAGLWRPLRASGGPCGPLAAPAGLWRPLRASGGPCRS